MKSIVDDLYIALGVVLAVVGLFLLLAVMAVLVLPFAALFAAVVIVVGIPAALTAPWWVGKVNINMNPRPDGG